MMDAHLYGVLETLTKDTGAFWTALYRVNQTILPIYNIPIIGKRDLYTYIYPKINTDNYAKKSEITCQDMEKTNKGAYNKIDNSAKVYLNYFEGFYKSSDLYASNAPNSKSEYICYNDSPEAYIIFRHFLSFVYYNHYIEANIHKGTLQYKIPLWFIPVFSSFVRVIYNNKKTIEISTKELLGKLNDEIYHVIFTNFPIIYSDHKDLSKDGNLHLLYRLNICTLYQIVTTYSTSYTYDDLLVTPLVAQTNPFFLQNIRQLRHASVFMFFTIVLEVYWRVVWKPLAELTDVQDVKKHYSYVQNPSPLLLCNTKALSHINKLLSDRYNSYFSKLSNVIIHIKQSYLQCKEAQDKTRHLQKIQKIATKYIDETANYNNSILRPLCEEIHQCLTDFAKASGMRLEIQDFKYIYKDYIALFYNTFGVYDMAVLSAKLITENSVLSPEDQYTLLSHRIIPYLQMFKQENEQELEKETARGKLYSLFSFNHNLLCHTFSVKDIAPLNFQNDCILLQQLFLLFRDKCNEVANYEPSDELCGFFDSLAKKISADCPENGSLFPIIFHRITGSL